MGPPARGLRLVGVCMTNYQRPHRAQKGVLKRQERHNARRIIRLINSNRCVLSPFSPHTEKGAQNPFVSLQRIYKTDKEVYPTLY